MGNPARIKCKDCKKDITNKARSRARSMAPELFTRQCPDGTPYDIDNDYFCPACRQKIKPSGKSLRYVPAASTGNASKRLRSDPDEENEPDCLNENVEESRFMENDENSAAECPSNDDSLQQSSENEDTSVPRSNKRVQSDQNFPQKESIAGNFEEDVQDGHQIEEMQQSEDIYADSQDPIRNVETTFSASEGSSFPSRSCRGRRLSGSSKKKVFLANTRSIPYSEKSCCVCKEEAKGSRSAIPQLVREAFWLETRIWIPPKNRSCSHHHDRTVFTQEAKQKLITGTIKDSAVMTTDAIESWVSGLTDKAQGSRIDVHSSELTDDDYHLLFGVNKQSFDEIFDTIKSHLNMTYLRTPRTALAIFLTKLRLGISQKMIGFLYGLPQENVSRIIGRVSKLLEDHLVPNFLGFFHKDRQGFISENDSNFVRKLYNVPNESLILVLDGTYLYTEKSSDHLLQKKSYSMQKGRNLLKVMVVVTPSGYIVDAVGMYYSDGQHNDAKMLQDMLQQPDGISRFIRVGDLFILDRGFRDIIRYLNEIGIKTMMPNLLSKGQKQFSPEEANQSRLVTLIRWVVEAVNGRLKNIFRYFEHVIQQQDFRENSNPKLNRYLRIACAIMNKTCPPIFVDKAEHQDILEEIRRREDEPNTLMDEVSANTKDFVTGRNCWTNYKSNELVDFPSLSVEELRRICLGKFNLNNARGYTDDHLRCDPDYTVQIHNTRDGLLRIKLKSKYRNSASHYQWIEFSTEEGMEKIQRYYCQCMGGARTLGCCSHVASVLWYLGFKRHVDPGYTPRKFGNDILDIVARKAAEQEEFGSMDEDLNEDSGSDSE